MSTRQEKNIRFYSQIAEKFGKQIRNDLIEKARANNSSSMKIMSLIHSFDFSQKPKYSIKKKSGIMLYTTKNYQKDKKQMVQSFKDRLKMNLDESRLRQQERTQNLVNQVRWRRSTMLENKQIRMQQFGVRKKRDVKIMKSLLQKSRQSLSRNKRQAQLQHTFMCLERRLKNSHESKQKRNL